MKKSFGRESRLCHSKDFQYILRRGNTLIKSYCKVYICQNTQKHNRLGVIASKKVMRLSVDRHKYKRIIRESFRLHSKALKNYDIIVMIRKLPRSKPELWSILDVLWKQINQLYGITIINNRVTIIKAD